MNQTPFKNSAQKNNRLERIWLLAKIEFKLRYYENKLGLLWALIRPVSLLLIYFIAFKVIMKTTIENYSIYLFAGLIVWQFYLEATDGLTRILSTKKYLYEYSNMLKIEIYLASLISILLGFVFNFSILLIFLFATGIGVNINILYSPLLLLVLFMLCFGMAMILSNLFIYFKDIGQIWPLLTQLLMWLSPLFLNAKDLESNIPHIEVFNPMYGIMTNFRNITMYHLPPDFNVLLINTAQAIVVFCVGYLMLKKMGGKASELL